MCKYHLAARFQAESDLKRVRVVLFFFNKTLLHSLRRRQAGGGLTGGGLVRLQTENVSAYMLVNTAINQSVNAGSGCVSVSAFMPHPSLER